MTFDYTEAKITVITTYLRRRAINQIHTNKTEVYLSGRNTLEETLVNIRSRYKFEQVLYISIS